MKPEARVFRCSACGAPAKEGARNCDFCRSPVATVRCAGCLQMNASASKHCSGCGHELGVQPFETLSKRYRCTGCSAAFAEVDSDGGALLDCLRCGGQFVSHPVLRALLERARGLGEPPLGTRRPQNPLDAPVVYRPCPACAALMHRRNFGGRSGVVVDVCALHGTWFDAGELPRVLAFVESGGLAASAAIASVEKQRARVALEPYDAPAADDSMAAAVAEAALELLDDVVTALGRLRK